MFNQEQFERIESLLTAILIETRFSNLSPEEKEKQWKYLKALKEEQELAQQERMNNIVKKKKNPVS